MPCLRVRLTQARAKAHHDLHSGLTTGSGEYVQNNDPEKMGPFRLPIPGVLPSQTHPVWALPVGTSFGAHDGRLIIPGPGTPVFAWFIEGDLSVPVCLPGSFPRSRTPDDIERDYPALVDETAHVAHGVLRPEAERDGRGVHLGRVGDLEHRLEAMPFCPIEARRWPTVWVLLLALMPYSPRTSASSSARPELPTQRLSSVTTNRMVAAAPGSPASASSALCSSS